MTAADSDLTGQLLARIEQGDPSALSAIMDLHRDYLLRLVEFRIDPNLRGRVDASDVVQETQLEAAQRIDDYLRRRPMTFRVWLRATACQRLNTLRRYHLKAEQRSARREVALPDSSSMALGKQLFEGRPSQVLEKRELAEQVRQALGQLNETDYEILLMRSFEGLSNQEAAESLGIEPATASKRYGRALLHLRDKLAARGLNDQM